MIMQRQADGTYSQIGFIRTPTEDIDKIVDRNGDVYFTKGFTRQITGTPPLSLNAIGKPIISYKIYGNSVQDGTPTPENPVEVQGVGNPVYAVLKDSDGNVLYDSDGFELHSDDVVGYEIPVVSRGKNGNIDPITTPIYLTEPIYKGDYIIKNKSGGKVHREWGVKVFDGTEIFFKNSNESNSYLYYTEYKGKKEACLCTHLSCVSNAPIYSTGINVVNGYNVMYLNFGAEIMTKHGNNVNGLKTYLAEEYSKGTPVTVYYPLATPTEEPIELPEIPTFDGTTIIETDTEISPSNIEASYKSRKKENEVA